MRETWREIACGAYPWRGGKKIALACRLRPNVERSTVDAGREVVLEPVHTEDVGHLRRRVVGKLEVRRRARARRVHGVDVAQRRRGQTEILESPVGREVEHLGESVQVRELRRGVSGRETRLAGLLRGRRDGCGHRRRGRRRRRRRGTRRRRARRRRRSGGDESHDAGFHVDHHVLVEADVGALGRGGFVRGRRGRNLCRRRELTRRQRHVFAPADALLELVVDGEFELETRRQRCRCDGRAPFGRLVMVVMMMVSVVVTVR